MTTFTTKRYADLPDYDDQRSFGPSQNIIVVTDAIGSITVEATTDDIDEFEKDTGRSIDSDEIDESTMQILIQHLKENDLLINS